MNQDYRGMTRLALVALACAALVWVGCRVARAAPVPAHLMHEPRHPAGESPRAVSPGYKWWYAGLLLEVVRVEGDDVVYRCLTEPARVWNSAGGGLSRQSVRQTRDEAARFPQACDRYQPFRLVVDEDE